VSKGNPKTASLVIEWSPRGVKAYDAVRGATQTFDSVQAAASNYGGKPVIVAVSRRAVFIRTTRVPDAAIADVRLVLSMRLGDLFPIPPSDLAYDFVMTDDVNADGRLAIVAAMSAQDLRRLLEECRSAGFKVQQVLPVAFGSVPLVESLSRTSAAVVTPDDEGIGIDIVEGRSLRYSRVSSNLTSPAAEVCRTFTVAGLPCGQMIASGGFNFVDSDMTTKSTSLEALLSNSATLPTINLEPPEVVALRAKKIRDTRQRTALLLFCGAVAMCGAAYWKYSSKAAAADIADRKQKQDIAKLQADQKVRQKDTDNATQAQNALDLAFKYGQRYSDIATTVAKCVPKDVWLGGLSVERGKRLVLRGVARNAEVVDTFVHTLEQEPEHRFRNVKLEFTNDGAIGLIPVVQFSVSAFPVGNVPLSDPTQVLKK